uniref:Apple domain-containing protein n=1 Tax=Alexandrium catenella TaxID=2925 RepID=A0A7S1MLY0_ALECA|mmetsp:Transcript_29624/g.80045  ORF Transcript_29624/g.80045 Transcript_29624/m.80045 type:complete len:169 (+) Transcript_29624:82-588(+)|eukprot:CAMPEP_0171217430 /NCGR_PEP_ID=MMETSP0790-20130122/32682_1 /TAXON_ID=2925 /ORGANISM="Alexandrium catenella, Strain OF101" /LENGTH=168 /DNA_ID=CAMNT_0011683221 /DNA_START=7 /DNA_END=513 /DNA_ORIENTATION=-
MAPPCKGFAAAWVASVVLMQGLLVGTATAGEEEALAVDDECRAGDAGCALNALQRRGAARADPDEAELVPDAEKEVPDGYQMFPQWNCYKPGAPSTDGYVGIVSVDSCADLCNYKHSATAAPGEYSCSGFVYMSSQAKCWLRSSGYHCFYEQPSTGEAASFDYYEKHN